MSSRAERGILPAELETFSAKIPPYTREPGRPTRVHPLLTIIPAFRTRNLRLSVCPPFRPSVPYGCSGIRGRQSFPSRTLTSTRRNVSGSATTRPTPSASATVFPCLGSPRRTKIRVESVAGPVPKNTTSSPRSRRARVAVRAKPGRRVPFSTSTRIRFPGDGMAYACPGTSSRFGSSSSERTPSRAKAPAATIPARTNRRDCSRSQPWVR